jgi:hypothetical protein
VVRATDRATATAMVLFGFSGARSDDAFHGPLSAGYGWWLIKSSGEALGVAAISYADGNRRDAQTSFSLCSTREFDHRPIVKLERADVTNNRRMVSFVAPSIASWWRL